MNGFTVKYQEVLEAHHRLAGRVYRTPLIRNETLDQRVGAKVYLKLENLQKTNAFKVRGATNRLLFLTEDERACGVITASSGNHGMGLAYAARQMGVRATVVMPATAPKTKARFIEACGATVILQGDTYDDSLRRAQELQKENGAVLVPSFNDPRIIAGQGTIGLEIAEDVPDVDTLIAPIGGGGLAAGLLIAREGRSSPQTVYGVEAEGAPSMLESLRRGDVAELETISTMADGIAVRRPGDLNFEILKRGIEDIVLVSDEQMVEALRFLATEVRIVAELAGAAGVAALLAGKLMVSGRCVACVITGGNIDPEPLAKLLA